MPLDENDIVTRFVFGRRKLTESEGRVTVKPLVFEPHRERNDLSVFRITDLKSVDERSIWFIGKIVEKERNPPPGLRGRADLLVSQIKDLKLRLVLDETPPRHADIKDLPFDSAEQSSKSLNIQHKLADIAEGFLSKDVEPSIDNILNEDVAVRPEFSSYL